MSNGRKQFAVYRLKHGVELLEALRCRSWSFIRKYQIRVTSDNYEQICVSPFTWDYEPRDIRRQLEEELPAPAMGNSLMVSDVLVITIDGITTAYYVDPDNLIVLTGFFQTSSSTALLSIDTTDYQIEGRPGIWLAADEIWLDGEHFFLMQSQKYGKKALYAVLDSDGKPVADDTAEGFSEAVKSQIRDYIQRKKAAKELPVGSSEVSPPENRQKSNENGEYLRSAEMSEEQSLSMIDGRMNNMPPDLPVQRHQRKKRRKGKLPRKGRESVLKRLREYQDELARQRGQAVMGKDTQDPPERRKT